MIKFFITDIDGTLTDGKIQYGGEGNKYISFSKKDGYGFQRLREEGIASVWITSEEKIDSHMQRAKDLEIPYFFQSENKFETISKFLESKNASWKEVAYIGDDIPDLSCILHAGRGFVPKDSVIHILSKIPESSSSYITMIGVTITSLSGGEGCVREAIEDVLKS